MKQGWTYKKLGEVCDFRSGFAFKSSKFTKSGEPIIRISDIQNEEIDESNLVYFDPKSYKEDLTKFLIYPDDILIAMSGGTTGKLGLNTSNRKFYLNQRVGVFRENKKYLDHRFLFYFLHTKSEESLRIAAGAAQPNLSTTQINSFLIPLAPLAEQQRIVSRLDSAFAHIDELKANAEKQLNDARALFQKALTKAMEPKEGWEEKKMKDIVHPDCSLSYGIVQPGEHIDGGVAVVRPVDFNNKIIVKVKGLKRTKKEISDAYKRTILRGGEILFCVRGTTGTMGLASEELNGCNVTRGIVPMFFDEETNLMFAYYQLLSPRLQDEIQKKTTGAALKQINIKDLRNLQLSLPPLSEQQRIASRLDSLSAHVRELEEVTQKTIAECDALKQALLRKVFE